MEENQIKPPKPDNYLVWAILTTVLCCLPFGIVSIVNSSKVDGLYASGNYDEALAKSKEAKKWAIVAAAVGGIVLLVYAIFVVFVGVNIANSKLDM